MANGKLIVVKSAQDVANLRSMNKMIHRPTVRHVIVSPQESLFDRAKTEALSPTAEKITHLFNEGGSSIAAPVFSMCLLLAVLTQLSGGDSLTVGSVLLALAVALTAGLAVKVAVLVLNHFRLVNVIDSLQTRLQS